MPGESSIKRKWWHGTLSIQNKDTLVELLKITSIDPLSPSINARYDAVFAYANANNTSTCETPLSIPVAAYNTESSPGFFVFRPNVTELTGVAVEIYNYQDAINLATRRLFNYYRTAAYDPIDTTCDSSYPTRHDTYKYEEVDNNVATVIHKYRFLSYYAQTTCCEININLPSSNIPQAIQSGPKTKIYYLLKDEVNSKYLIYSYDFALLSGALVSHGEIAQDTIPSGLTIHDITWYFTGLFCITSDGIYILYPGSSTRDAVLGEKMTINYNNLLTPLQIQYLFSILQQSIEYNKYDSFFYAIVGTKKYEWDDLS
jgi:hypothetical protein